MNISKIVAIMLISIVAATALVSAESALNTQVVNPTGKYSLGPSTTGKMVQPKTLETTRGRMLGKVPPGLIEGKPNLDKSLVPEVRLPQRFMSDVWTYEGGRCEAAAEGPRFTVGVWSCYMGMTQLERTSHTKVQKTVFSCAKPQTLQCKGTHCPTSVCRAPGRKLAK